MIIVGAAVLIGVVAAGLLVWRTIILRLDHIDYLLMRLVREADDRHPQIDMLNMVATDDGLVPRSEFEGETKRDV